MLQRPSSGKQAEGVPKLAVQPVHNIFSTSFPHLRLPVTLVSNAMMRLE